MLIDNKIKESTVLTGFIGKKALVYHRTGKGNRNVDDIKKIIQSIIKNGFSPGSGDFYCPGLYATGDKASQFKGDMSGYGIGIIEFSVDLQGILLFDYRLTKPVYGRTLGIDEQLRLLGIKNNNKLIQALSDDLLWTVEGGDAKRISANRAKEIWTGLILNYSAKSGGSNYSSIQQAVQQLYPQPRASRDPNEPGPLELYLECTPKDLQEARMIARNNKITGIALSGGHDGNVLVVYEKAVKSKVKITQWGIFSPDDPDATDERNMAVPWQPASAEVTPTELLIGGLRRVGYPSSGNFGEAYLEGIEKTGLAEGVDFIKTNFKNVGNPKSLFRDMSICFFRDKKYFIVGGKWLRGECNADYFGRSTLVSRQLQLAGKSEIDDKDNPVFVGGTFTGKEFTGIFKGGVFKGEKFSGLFVGGVIDLDSKIEWTDSAQVDNSPESKKLKRSILINGVLHELPDTLPSTMSAYIKMVQAGGLNSSDAVSTDASLMSAIQRTSAYPIDVLFIDNDWRGSKDISSGLASFKKAYPWLFAKGQRLRVMNIKIRVTKDKIILEEGILMQGGYYFDEYGKKVEVKGGEIRSYNIFEGILVGGAYSNGSFRGKFESGVFNLDKAIWESKVNYIPVISANINILYKNRDIVLDEKAFLFPDASGKNPLFPTFEHVLNGIKTGLYFSTIANYEKTLKNAKKGLGKPPILLSKAGMAIVKQGLNATNLDDEEWDQIIDESFVDSFNILNYLENRNIKITPEEGLMLYENICLKSPFLFELAEDELSRKPSVEQLIEASYMLDNLNDEEQLALYELFKASYVKATGASFDQEDFNWRAANWIFLGIPPKNSDVSQAGGIAIRKQLSNQMYKLCASFGNFRAIFKGFEELKQRYGHFPIWGFVTDEIKRMIIKRDKDFCSLPGVVVKAMEGIIKKISNGEVKSVGLDGSLMVETPAGLMKKFFTVNKVYLAWLIDSVEDPKNASRLPMPQAALTPLLALIKTLI